VSTVKGFFVYMHYPLKFPMETPVSSLSFV